MKPAEAALEVGTPVADGNDDRKRWPPWLQARRTGGDIIHDKPSPVKDRHVPECVSVPGTARTRALTAGHRTGRIDSPMGAHGVGIRPIVASRSRRAAGL